MRSGKFNVQNLFIDINFMYHSRKPVLPIEMELGDLEMDGSVSGDLKAIEEHCEKIAALKEKVFNSAEENIKCAQIRYKRDYDNKHAGRRKVCMYIQSCITIILTHGRLAIILNIMQ